MLEITSLRNGAVLNHRNGTETEDALEIKVEGVTTSQAEVKVNGIPAAKFDRLFSASVRLTKKVNRILVESSDAFGERTQSITVVWDKKSTPRYSFFFDDCSFFLRAIAQSRPKSIFEEMFLRRLRSIHGKYGTKFTLNLFFHDDHHNFSISDFPVDYKAEFSANSDWLKMSFHAKSEFPDRPYQSSDSATLAADYDRVYHEVCRFAGADSFIAPNVIHWSMTNPENFPVLKDRGVRCLTGAFLGGVSHIGEKHTLEVTDIGYHYEKDVAQYIKKAHCYYDRRFDLLLCDNLLCCNYLDIEDIRNCFQELKANPRDTISLMSHEQYSYPDYFNYIPDHLDRIEEACRLATEAGYRPIWLAQGLFGNMAWEE